MVKFVPVRVTLVPIGPEIGVNPLIVGATPKPAALVAVPPGVVTEIVPLVAAAGTVAVTLVAVTTVKLVAGVPWNVTAVAPPRFVPVIVTVEPTAPKAGEMPVMTGMGVKFATLVAVPPGVVTEIVPLVAAGGTLAVMLVAVSTLSAVPAVPLNLTEVAPVKFVPVRVTVVPATPDVGVKLVRVGGGMTVKEEALVPVTDDAVTLMVPDVAPAGTVAVTLVSDTKVKAAETPWNFTALAPVKFAPLIVTSVPTGPDAGVKLEMEGTRENGVELVATAIGVATLMKPVVAPRGTVTAMLVAELTVKDVAATPLNLTEVALVKFFPVIVTDVPTPPDAGLKSVMMGPTVKVAALVPVPEGLVTLIAPVAAPAGTVTVMVVAGVPTVNVVAATPPNLTAVAPVKFVPVTVTEAPTTPDAGEKPVTVGA